MRDDEETPEARAMVAKAPDQVLVDVVMPVLQLELERLNYRSRRISSGLRMEDVDKLVKLARAVVSVRDSETKAKDAGVKTPESLEGMTPEELYQYAAQLMKANGQSIDRAAMKAYRKGSSQ